VRVFVDTNVLVSAFASRGLCAEVLELVLLDHDWILGRNVVRELDEALRERLKLPFRHPAEIVDFILGEVAQLIDKADAASVNVDAADALVLGEALAARGELFVTGDTALLGRGINCAGRTRAAKRTALADRQRRYCLQIFQITPVPGICTSGPLLAPTKWVSSPLSRTAP